MIESALTSPIPGNFISSDFVAVLMLMISFSDICIAVGRSL